MAVTRREFVTRLGTMAAALGLSQTDMFAMTQALGHGAPWNSPDAWSTKPKVIWVHGAECTGCSTSLLGLFEDVRGEAIPGSGVSTAMALGAIGTGTVPANTAAAAAALMTSTASHPWGHRTLQMTQAVVGGDVESLADPTNGIYMATIADVLIDFLDVQYHETIMAAGGDTCYKALNDAIAGTAPFILVVEGAVQTYAKGGYWGKTGAGTTAGANKTDANWCSVAAKGTIGAHGYHNELSFDDVVKGLATNANCASIIPIGQCACFGGYPACVGPGLAASSTGTKSQTNAQGVYDFLSSQGVASTVLAKVANAPGCPTNPWWFVLTAVLTLVKVITGTDLTGGLDSQHRYTNVYGTLLHSKYCPRYPKYAMRVFATKPGDDGCLKNIGCKGLSTRSLCGRHGWNAQQPTNDTNALAETIMYPQPGTVVAAQGDTTTIGTNCLNAGHPCMGCTEKGYPDAFAPFVIR